MKKFCIFIMCVLFSCATFAQKEHLKFMGIPLNGTITQFQVKLQAKGIRYNAGISKILPAGCRGFDGVFAGENADIFIYYNTNTKVVYRGKAVVMNNTLDIAEQKYRNFKEMLSSKYMCQEEDVDFNGYKSSTFLSALGVISLYIAKNEYDYKSYALHIDYEDLENSISNISNKMDDL